MAVIQSVVWTINRATCTTRKWLAIALFELRDRGPQVSFGTL